MSAPRELADKRIARQQATTISERGYLMDEATIEPYEGTAPVELAAAVRAIQFATEAVERAINAQAQASALHERAAVLRVRSSHTSAASRARRAHLQLAAK